MSAMVARNIVCEAMLWVCVKHRQGLQIAVEMSLKRVVRC